MVAILFTVFEHYASFAFTYELRNLAVSYTEPRITDLRFTEELSYDFFLV